MSAYSTQEITREDALKQITEAFKEATDEQIADFLFELVGKYKGCNYQIVAQVDHHADDPDV